MAWSLNSKWLSSLAACRYNVKVVMLKLDAEHIILGPQAALVRICVSDLGNEPKLETLNHNLATMRQRYQHLYVLIQNMSALTREYMAISGPNKRREAVLVELALLKNVFPIHTDDDMQSAQVLSELMRMQSPLPVPPLLLTNPGVLEKPISFLTLAAPQHLNTAFAILLLVKYRRLSAILALAPEQLSHAAGMPLVQAEHVVRCFRRRVDANQAKEI
jgi:hypothetical protein